MPAPRGWPRLGAQLSQRLLAGGAARALCLHRLLQLLDLLSAEIKRRPRLLGGLPRGLQVGRQPFAGGEGLVAIGPELRRLGLGLRELTLRSVVRGAGLRGVALAPIDLRLQAAGPRGGLRELAAQVA
jgi:hypothetical protein